MAAPDRSHLPGWLTGEDDGEGPRDSGYTPGPGTTDVVAPRAVAQTVDWAVVVPPVLVLEFFLAGTGLPLLLRVPIEMTVYLAYCVLLEAFNGGQTVGKALFGIVVVTEDGDPITPRQAVLRNLPAFLAGYWVPYIVAIFSVVSTPLHQRVFDRVAGTVVMRI